MKHFFFFSAFIFIAVISFSQEYDPYTYQDIKPKKAINDKLFFGGGFSFQFGTFINLNLFPEIGYHLTEKIDVGAGAYYIFLKSNYYHYTDRVYGGKLFIRFFIADNFYLTGEYETLNIADYDLYTGQYTGQRIFIDGLPLGIGWKQQAGEHFAILTSLMYNVLHTEKTPYSNPIFRISFVF